MRCAFGRGGGSAPTTSRAVYRARYAILLDGGFVTKKLYEFLRRPATVDDVVRECERLERLPCVRDYELLRIYYGPRFRPRNGV